MKILQAACVGELPNGRHYAEPALGQCRCGACLWLVDVVNSCDCGQEYSRTGSLLRDRDAWDDDRDAYLDDAIPVF